MGWDYRRMGASVDIWMILAIVTTTMGAVGWARMHYLEQQRVADWRRIGKLLNYLRQTNADPRVVAQILAEE